MAKSVEEIERELRDSAERMKLVQDASRRNRAAREGGEPQTEPRAPIDSRGPVIRGT